MSHHHNCAGAIWTRKMGGVMPSVNVDYESFASKEVIYTLKVSILGRKYIVIETFGGIVVGVKNGAIL